MSHARKRKDYSISETVDFAFRDDSSVTVERRIDEVGATSISLGVRDEDGDFANITVPLDVAREIADAIHRLSNDSKQDPYY